MNPLEPTSYTCPRCSFKAASVEAGAHDCVSVLESQLQSANHLLSIVTAERDHYRKQSKRVIQERDALRKVALAPKNDGMRVCGTSLLSNPKRAGIKFMLQEMDKHLKEVSRRYYAGDTAVVDEFLQLYSYTETRPVNPVTEVTPGPTENSPESYRQHHLTMDMFRQTQWAPNMRAVHRSRPHESFPVASVDFEELLVGLTGFIGGAEPDEIHWVRGENLLQITPPAASPAAPEHPQPSADDTPHSSAPASDQP